MALLLTGCGSGERQANIALRKQVQDLEAKVADADRRRLGDEATLRSLQSGATTVPALPAERLAVLFTTHDIVLNRLTGGTELDPAKAGDDGLKIYVTPVDETGDELKAAGVFVVEAFDLADGAKQLGKWEFDVAATRRAWNGSALLYEYVLVCPWQTPPTRSDLTLKITFTDELTGRLFAKQKQVTVKVPSEAVK